MGGLERLYKRRIQSAEVQKKIQPYKQKIEEAKIQIEEAKIQIKKLKKQNN